MAHDLMHYTGYDAIVGKDGLWILERQDGGYAIGLEKQGKKFVFEIDSYGLSNNEKNIKFKSENIDGLEPEILGRDVMGVKAPVVALKKSGMDFVISITEAQRNFLVRELKDLDGITQDYNKKRY